MTTEIRTTRTPEPWRWEPSKKSYDGRTMKYLVGADGQGFAHTVGLGELRDTANANLIAAAPDLFKALKALSEACYTADLHEELSDFIDGALLDAARDAIAKAEGR
jgi:hypothetical protein